MYVVFTQAPRLIRTYMHLGRAVFNKLTSVAGIGEVRWGYVTQSEREERKKPFPLLPAVMSSDHG